MIRPSPKFDPIRLAGLGLCLLAWCTQAQSFSFVSSRGELGASDSIDWDGVGPTGTVRDRLFSIATSVNRWQVGVTKASKGSFERRDQGNGWEGNFTRGDALLWTQGAVGPISLTFAVPIEGIGMQIQKADLSNPLFYASIEAFDSSNSSLGRFDRQGRSTGAGDGSALFLGVRTALPNIARVEVNVANGFDFAINQVSIVPEPLESSLVTGLAAIALTARRRSRRSSERI